MLRVLRAYLWAIWTRDCVWILLGSIATVAMIVAAPIAARTSLFGQDVLRIYLAPYISFMQFLMLKIFLFPWDFKRRRMSFHTSSSTRPASTLNLVAAPILTGTGVVVLFWFVACRLMFQRVGIPIPFLAPATAMTVTLAALQTGLGTLDERGDPRAILNSLLFILSFIPYLILPLALVTNVLRYNMSYGLLMLSFMTYYLIIQSAFRAARSDRRGDFAEPLRILPVEERIQRFLLGTRAEPVGLTTPVKAQFWIEYTSLKVRPRLFYGLLLWMCCHLFFENNDPSRSMNQELFLFLIFMPFLILQITSYHLGAFPSNSDSRLGYDDFFRLRPFSSAKFVSVKYRIVTTNGFRYVLFYLITSFIIFIIYRYYWNYDFDHIIIFYIRWGRSTILTFWCSLLISFVVVFWRAETDLLVPAITQRRNPWLGVPAVFITLLYSNIFPFGCFAYLGAPRLKPYLMDFFRFFFVGSFIVKVSLACIAYRAALRLRLIGRRTLILGIASWAGFSACGFVLYRIVFEGRSPPIQPIFAVMGIASLVPLCRYALAPLAMYWSRHR